MEKHESRCNENTASSCQHCCSAAANTFTSGRQNIELLVLEKHEIKVFSESEHLDLILFLSGDMRAAGTQDG